MSIDTITTELMLLSWRESSSGGASVTFALPDAESLEAFKLMTTAKGGKGGQRFMAAMALLGDDETPQPIPSKPAKAPTPQPASKGKLGPRALLAVQLCANPEFQDWIRPLYDRLMGGNGSSWGDVAPEDFTDAKTDKQKREAWAAHVVKVFCDCTESRRELDDDPDCARLFEQRIRRPWLAHQEVTA